MSDIKDIFEAKGFVVMNKILAKDELNVLVDKCESEINAKVGTRNLLDFDWVNKLAEKLIKNDLIHCLLPKGAVVVQCNYFSKDAENNWHVSLHRDLSVPLKSQVSSAKWSGWSNKEGILYAQAPRSVLSKMVAIRLHLENNNDENGALEVVSGSHKNRDQKGERSLCVVEKGGVLIMRPLLLHSSTKLKSGKRRVLHFVFGPEKLPDGAQWANVL